MIPVRISSPTPQEPRFTLRSVAELVSGDGENRWLQGAELERFVCGGLPQLLDQCDPTEEQTYLDLPASRTHGTFAVVLGTRCTARSIGSPAEFLRRVTLSFRAVETMGAERELWAGSSDLANPALTDNDATMLNASVATHPVEALALLELAIAADGRRGLIHARRSVVTAWQRYHLVHIEGSGDSAYLSTINGTPIAAGRGYTGVGPDGATNAAVSGTTEWAYASGPVQIRRSPNEYTPQEADFATMARRTNDVFFNVGREYLVTWDNCIHAAVRIDRAL